MDVFFFIIPGNNDGMFQNITHIIYFVCNVIVWMFMHSLYKCCFFVVLFCQLTTVQYTSDNMHTIQSKDAIAPKPLHGP